MVSPALTYGGFATERYGIIFDHLSAEQLCEDVAKLRTKNMKAQFNDWAFFIGSKSPRILRAIKTKSLFRDVRQR